MSLGLIPYQPLPFGLEENCTLPCSSWIQKIARTDRTSFQFTYGACGNTNNVLTNGDFTSGGTGWTVTGAWTYSFGWANSPLGGAGSIQQAISLTGFVELTFAIHRVQSRGVYGGTLDLVVSPVGKGTTWLSKRRRHDTVSMVGPLGKPFTLPTQSDRKSTRLNSSHHG